MKKTIVLNEVFFFDTYGGVAVDTIIRNGEVVYYVINRSLKSENRNWEVIAFYSMGEIFEYLHDNGLDYKVDYRYRKGEVFATYADYCKWFNEHNSSEDVETIEV